MMPDKDSKYILKRSQDLGVNSINLVELAIQVMKRVPRFLAIYLEMCTPQERLAFLGDLPGFYFDYTELRLLADFLGLYFGLKVERGETRELTKQTVGYFNKDFAQLFDTLVWESDSVAFCHGLLADLIRDLGALKRVTSEDLDAISAKDVSYLNNTSTFNVDKTASGGGIGANKTTSTRQASVRGVKITTGAEKYESMTQYRQILETNIRETLAHNQTTKHLVNPELLADNVKKTFSDVR